LLAEVGVELRMVPAQTKKQAGAKKSYQKWRNYGKIDEGVIPAVIS
jgi:hypothetical protein